MPEFDLTVRANRVDGDTLLLDGLALAQAFFGNDPGSQPEGYDSVASLDEPHRTEDADITTVNTTMRARSPHSAWKPVLDGDQAWLREIPLDLDIVKAGEDEWRTRSGEDLLASAIAACVHPGICIAVATKVLHLKGPRFVSILDRYAAE